MQTKVKGIWEKIKAFFKKLNKKVRILLGVGAAAVLILIGVLLFLNSRTEYALLQGGLNASEISNLVQFLDSNGVTDYKVEGDKVFVPEGRESQLQAQLATSGNLTTGFLYEFVTENTSGFSTSSERDWAQLVGSQERLGAIIRQFQGVRQAWVTITPGTERVYVLDPKATPATASVTIELSGNEPLSSGVVEAIRNTVAHSVQGLEISSVSIEDTMGNNYSGTTTGIGQVSEASALKLQVEQEINNTVRMQVLDALTAIYGKDNVKVSVNTTVDMDRRVVNTTSYNQPIGSVEGGGLIGTEKWFWETINDGTEPVGGVVGTESNADVPGYPNLEPDLDGDQDYAGAQGERDHLVDTTTEQREVLSAKITDITVAVTINQNAANANSVSADELRSHVATISNIGSTDPASRVSVLIAPFDQPQTEPGGIAGLPAALGLPGWVLYAAIGGLVLFLLLLVLILLLVRRRKKKRLAEQQALEAEMEAMEAAEAAAAAAAAVEIPPAGGADIMDINTEKSMELRKIVRQFAQNNPEIAAQLVKAWLRGEDNTNG